MSFEQFLAVCAAVLVVFVGAACWLVVSIKDDVQRGMSDE